MLKLKKFRPEVIESFIKTGKSDVLPPKIQQYILELNDTWLMLTGEADFKEETDSEGLTVFEPRTKRGMASCDVANKLVKLHSISLRTAWNRIKDSLVYFREISIPSEVWKFYHAMRAEALCEEAREKGDYGSAFKFLVLAEKLRSEASPDNPISEEYRELHDIILSPDLKLERLGLESFSKQDLYNQSKEMIKRFKVDSETTLLLEEEAAQTIGI